MSADNTELAVIDAAPVSLGSELAALEQGGTDMYSSIKSNDFEDRLTVLKAVSSSLPLADHLNTSIPVKHIIVQSVDMKNEKTGLIEAQPRIVFIAEDGTAFHAISAPLYRDVKNWIKLLGEPGEWPTAVPFTFTREGSGSQQFFKARVS